MGLLLERLFFLLSYLALVLKRLASGWSGVLCSRERVIAAMLTLAD